MKANSPEKLQGHRVTPTAVLLAIGLIPLNAFGQQNVYSRGESGTGLWWNDNVNNRPWFYSSSGDQNRPDNFFTRHNVFVGHNNNTAMTVNGAFFQLRTLSLESGASSNRVFNASEGGGISLSVGFTNDSVGTHSFNVPIGVDGATVGFAVNTGSVSFTNTFFVNGNIAAFSGAGATSVSGVMSGSGGSVTKSGGGVLTLSGENSYSGGTSVTGGALLVNNTSGSGTGSGSVSVGTAGTLGGSGTISGATTINGTHAAGNNGVGQQSFGGSLTYVGGSIFSWELAAGPSDPGAGTNNSGAYDKVLASGAVTGTSAFFVSAFGNSFTEAFWDTNKSWSDIFTAGLGSQPLQSIFSTFSGTNVSTTGLVTNQGQFSFSGNTLNWTAVPEPSSALAGLLVAAGMMRRRRPI
jgi:autotransporter-associated beta strand protein